MAGRPRAFARGRRRAKGARRAAERGPAREAHERHLERHARLAAPNDVVERPREALKQARKVVRLGAGGEGRRPRAISSSARSSNSLSDRGTSEDWPSGARRRPWPRRGCAGARGCPSRRAAGRTLARARRSTTPRHAAASPATSAEASSCRILRSATPSTRVTSSPVSFVAAEGDHLVEEAHRVAHRARGFAREHLDRRGVRLDALLHEDLVEPPRDRLRRDQLEVVALAARQDRDRDLVHLRRREDELHVRRRLLERLQERVPRRRREHVHLVDDVDLEAVARGTEAHPLLQPAHLVDAVVARAVDLLHVEVVARR